MLAKKLSAIRFNLMSQQTIIGTASVLLTVLVLVAIGAWQSSNFSRSAEAEAQKLSDADLNHITEGVINLIKTQDETLRQRVDENLNVANFALKQAGGISLSSQAVSWTATNQVDNQKTTVTLPKMMIGGTWLGINAEAQRETPLVDQVKALVGGTSTVFQRMNEKGDMLRVGTNVIKQDGTRAIGTYIPAANPDGSANQVISTVMKGGVYRGMAMVMDAWYITAYEPLLGPDGKVIGMLYVGVRQETNDTLRKSIMNVQIGKSGYVFVLQGKGASRGTYILSGEGKRDGENVWDTQDANGNQYIQAIIDKAVALQPGQTDTLEYTWQNSDEAAPRQKVVRIAYYQPWDWVIGASAYKDELISYQIPLQKGRQEMILIFILSGLGLAALGGLAAYLFARNISRPVISMKETAQRIADVDLANLAAEMNRLAKGDLTGTVSVTSQEVRLHRRDEIGQMGVAFNGMIARLKEVGEAYREMLDNLRNLVGEVAESAGQLNAASGQLSTASVESGQAASQIAATMQQVAEGITQQSESSSRTAASVEKMSRSVKRVAVGAQDQSRAVVEASEITSQINSRVQRVAANAQLGTKSAGEAAATARSGVRIVEETILGMQEVKNRVSSSAQKVEEMGQRSEKIGAIVEMIEDIASQTNLLALNAAIEAARAGEHGKGFAVVADEVRKLAEKSSTATKEIAGLVKGIQAGVSEAMAAMGASGVEVEKGVARANQSGQALESILERVEAVTRQVAEIDTAAQQMSASANELVRAMDKVSVVVKENTAVTDQMAGGIGEVTEAVENIASVSEENSAAIEEVSASAEEMSSQAEEVTASAQTLAEMAQALQELVNRFALEEGQAKAAGRERVLRLDLPTEPGEIYIGPDRRRGLSDQVREAARSGSHTDILN